MILIIIKFNYFFIMKNNKTLVGVIGDKDTVTGFLLAGIGEKDSKGKSNFLVVEEDTSP